jgi:hypothetical protein
MNEQTKPGWQRPENWTSWIPVLAAGAAGIYAWDKILPFLLNLMENTLLFAIYGAALTALVFLVTSKDWHRVVWILNKRLWAWLTNFVIRIDPIGILKDTHGEVLEKIKEISRSEASLREQIRSLEDVIETGDKEMEENWKQMAAAKKAAKAGNKSMGRTAVLAGRQAGRIKQSNVTLNQLLTKLRKFLDITVRMREGAEFAAEDMKQTIGVEERRRKAVKAAYKALSLANQIIKGDKDRELYDMTLEHLNNEHFELIGQIEQFQAASENALNTMDLQNMVFEEDAFAGLEAWENKTVGKGRVRVDDGSGEQAAAEQEDLEASRTDAPRKKQQSYTDLFDIKK